MFGANAWIVEAGADRFRADDLPVTVLQDHRARPVQHARRSVHERRGVLADLVAFAASLGAVERDVSVIDEGVEQPDRVTATTDTRDCSRGQLAGRREYLRTRFNADHTLKIANHQRKR